VLVAYLADVCVLALLAAVPGPDVAVVTRFAVTRGRAPANSAAIGVVIGLAFWGTLTVVGLAGLLAASAEVYTAVKLLGAAYLVCLGVRILRQSNASRDPTQGAEGDKRGAPLRAGLLTNVLNPKIAVFYTGILPSLVPHGASPHLWLPMLVATHAALSMALLLGYAIVLSRSWSVLGDLVSGGCLTG
jgi:threonine/homoserine/homoserine lactone efflux protein